MKKNIFPKVKAGFSLLVLILAFFVTNIEPARAMPTEVILSIPEAQRTILQKIQVYADKAWKTYGAKLVGTTVRNTLNRVALDAAKYVASAGEGQKPTYVVEGLGSYWRNVGDAAAGDFIDGLSETWGVDLCQPPDANIQAKIGLGLVQTLAPEAPNCTITNLVNNYSTAFDKFEAMKSGDYLKAINVSFSPGASDLSGALTLFGRKAELSTKAAEDAKDETLVTQGWLDVRNIAGKLEGTPGAAKDDLKIAKDVKAQSLLSTTGDALVDASNTFLNQLAYESFQRVLRELNKNGSNSTSEPLNTDKLSNGFEKLVQYGESVISEKLASVIKPRFDVRSDYSILSELASCANINNPGPTNCVIDDKFSQAISEKLTVGDALAKGYLHGDWLVSNNNKSDSTYTLRSAGILRKYRIIPVGWEQAISVAAEKKYRVTLQDLISCFDGTGLFSNDFDKNNQAWCRGLVDPNWVLKAPLNFCGKQGNGNQILSSMISQDALGSSTLAVSRATDYCADDQTCIKEKADGSCEVYGYCNEEKRTWKFGSDSCEPVYNTCQTFTSVSEKQTASFLENTLDYSTCDSNNSGCKQYSYKGAYTSSTNNIAWDKNYSIFFNNKAVTCDASNEACTQLLRGKPGWTDVNYIMDADFSLNNIGDTSASATSWHWPVVNGVGSIIYDDGKALSIDGSSSAALRVTNDKNVLPKNLAPISGWSYTLSAEIKINTGNSVTMTLGDNGDKAGTSATSWTLVSVTASNTNNLNFEISGTGSKNLVNFSIRNLKLTPNNYYAGYSSYAAFPVYEKLLPTYLEQSCYNSVSGTGDYTLKDNAPAVCDNFARKCNRNEVGCELFTSVKDIFAVAAKANVNDYCDAQCVGYDTYLAKASYFYGTSADNLIPDKTKSCNAESAGCASFTNLDAATQGGESVEYYAKVRQCIKPDTASCSDFYSWDNAQLKVMSLKKNGTDPFVVNVTLDKTCTKATYNLPVTHPDYNPDCREFYNKSGSITYHIISNTVSCSDDCRAYRLNEKNIDKNLNSGTCVDATGVDRTWDTKQNACYVCQNGGVWDANQSACVYKVIPSEGTACAAESVGCREYNGNNGNSLKLSATYDFENGVDGFYALNGGFVVQGSESTVKNGHSLNIAGNVAVDASSFAKKDLAYVAKFMAKASSAVIVNLSFENSKEASIFNVDDKNPQGNISIKGDSQWHLYEVNLSKLDHETATEYLKINVGGNLTIDNLIINEVTDRYYLIQGSSQVPNVCYYDMSDTYQGPNYNLGCAAYTDRAGTTHNLHQFSELCQNSAVGCEQMIQTNNSANSYGYNVNLNNVDRTVACTAGTPGCIEVKNAEAIYAVFDSNKQCNKADAGCSRFGYLKTVANTSTWVDVFKKNLPDAYNNETSSPLCQSTEVGCDTWTYGNGSASYFKTPGLNTCIFKNNYWYKSPVKRCDTNGTGDGKITDNEKVGAVCLADSDCGAKKCITDTNDYPCSTTYLKTIGLGGINGRVATPDGAVGLCNVASAGCGEYIDPVSKYVNNLVYNPTAQEIDGVAADKWVETDDANYYTQKISVKPNKLYILQVDGDVSFPVTLDKFSTVDNGSGGTVRILGADNKLGDLVPRVTSTSSVMFNTGANIYLNVYRYGVSTATVKAANISIKEAVVNYQLSDNIDTTTCNGLVNTDTGCVLFNARTQAGKSGLKRNIFNATLTNEGSAPVSCSSTDTSCLNNANSVIKVSPDRVCSRWLSCQTYSEDPITFERTCYKMGECDQLNDKNECGNFLPLNETNRDIKNSQNKNATGYSLLNNWYIGGMKEVGQNTDAHFDFEDNSVNLSCINNNPNQPCTAELILTPDKKPNEVLADYPAHGKGYIKVLNYTQVSPQNTTVYVNQDYYINYLVNTKGSSAKARVLIIDSKTGSVKATFTDSANNGWERKVYKFNIASTGNKNTQVDIKISLTSDTTSATEGYVFFDDINIEPVLQTGTNSYVARDCRLYPSDDSTSCLSINNNVIKDGLSGYCLQYDPLNPGVCLMWYPVDKIASISKSDQVNLGYSGKFPLYYCTQANGDFSLAKKVIASSNSYSCEGCNNLAEKKSACGNVTDNNNPKDSGPIVGYCGSVVDSNYITIRVNEGYKGAIWPLAGTPSKTKELCIPNPAKLLIKSKEVVIDALKGDIYGKTCGYPNDSDAKITYYEGWTIYNGSFQKITTRNIDESANATNPGFDSIMVLDNGKNSESDLKSISSSDSTKNYQIGCNKFTQLINSNGDDMAWAERVSKNSTFAFTTPLINYGRDNEDVPFGAAILPSDYVLKTSNKLITLRNQYSAQNQEKLFAGRPYGCFGANCNMIGQCSLNSSIYCIYSASDASLNTKGCKSSLDWGTCQQLWTSFQSSAQALVNLNNIFVKKYADYTYSSGAYTGENIAPYTPPGPCLSTRTPGAICFYSPTISNAQLKSGGVSLPITGNNFKIEYGGLYQLEFDAYVDAEQQPLKQIQVYWGKEDGTQVVTNFDNTVKEDASSKKQYYHISLTHYYLKGDKPLEIRITDNWNAHKCLSIVSGSWSNACNAL